MAKAFRIKIKNPGTPVTRGPSERERFWNALAFRVSDRSPRMDWHILAREIKESADSPSPTSEVYFDIERDLERYFPRRLKQVLWETIGDGGLGLEVEFAIFHIEYGSLEIILGALGIEKTTAIYGIALPAFMSMVVASVPEALRKTLDLPNDIEFDVTISELNSNSAFPTKVTQENTTDTTTSRSDKVLRALSLLSVSYLGPVLLGMIVLYFAGSMALDAMKTASTERTIVMQQFSDLTKQQMAEAGEENKNTVALLSTFLHEATTNNQSLIDSIHKITADENQKISGICSPTIESKP